MKKSIGKRAGALIIALIISMAASTSAMATEVHDKKDITSSAAKSIVVAESTATTVSNNAISTNGSDIVPYADVIRVVFREYNGKKQMRRWNQTWGYWVDPDWITIS